ncbi:MAG: glycosyltransferase family 4 protein [Ignavibacteriae bacterium]|nr:glycosyltransferase family 4 protein [Ignavibacteriota bacterium]
MISLNNQRKTFFFLPVYPKWETGGQKMQSIIFEKLKSKNMPSFVFGNSDKIKTINSYKLLKVLFGLKCYFMLPRRSVIVVTGNDCVHLVLPLLLNRIWGNHYYLMVVHHLITEEKTKKLLKLLEHWFILHSHKIITISDSTNKDLMESGLIKHPVPVLTPGVDNDLIPDKGLKYEDIKQKVRKPCGKIKLLFIGTVEERKGLIYLLHAIAKMKEINLELVIAGKFSDNDDYYMKLRNFISESGISDRIIFSGRISQHELMKLLAESDIFVFPSLWEGYGMVVCEAMSSGLPVIISDIPSLHSIVDNGINGLMVKPRDSDSLKEAIIKVVTDSALMETLSKNAFIKSRSFPSWDDTANEFRKILDTII